MKFPGGGGMPNMQQMMKQAQQMQQRMAEQIAAIRVEGTAGGGAVKVQVDGEMKCLGVTIDPDAAGDAEMLQDMVMAAINEAHSKVEDQKKGLMGGMLGGMGLPPGLF
jgi:nucleoid-associated protein EbfC